MKKYYVRVRFVEVVEGEVYAESEEDATQQVLCGAYVAVSGDIVDSLVDILDVKEAETQRDLERKYCNRLVMQSGIEYSDVPQGAIVFNKESENE